MKHVFTLVCPVVQYDTRSTKTVSVCATEEIAEREASKLRGKSNLGPVKYTEVKIVKLEFIAE